MLIVCTHAYKKSGMRDRATQVSNPDNVIKALRARCCLTRSSPPAPVVIEDHVWIRSKVTILPGVHIGCYSAIGAGGVVTKDIPSHCLAVGNPARVIRRLDDLDATSASRDLVAALPGT